MDVKRPPFETFEPGEYPSRDHFDTVELKQDGWFVCLEIEGSSWDLWSRSSRLIKSGTINGDLSRSVLYGEYLFGTEWAKDRADYGAIVVFDSTILIGQDMTSMPLSRRRKRMRKFLDKTACALHPEIPLLMIDQYPIELADDIWQVHVIGEKYEGLVFKNQSMLWGDPMGRMKAQATMDYVCLGFEESESETYEGWGVACVVGGLYVSGELVRTCKVSGLTNDLRKEFFDNGSAYVGKVFEAEGKKISKKGALRHPNFIRWRDDKAPEECTWPLTSPKIKS